jgi:hypothetical protein
LAFCILTSGGIPSRIFNVDTGGQSHVPADVIRIERASVMHFNGRHVGHQSLPARFVEDIRLLLLLGIERFIGRHVRSVVAMLTKLSRLLAIQKLLASHRLRGKQLSEGTRVHVTSSRNVSSL